MTKITQEYLLKMTATGLKEISTGIKQLNANLTGVDNSAGKATNAINKGAKANDNYSKKAKGVGQLTNNQTKSFSKMAQGMSGTLVPAYAAVAANIFALTAAFGALKRAADLEIITESAETLAIQTGRSLLNLSRGMKDITNNAINMKDALESASIAASAGFNDQSIKDLTQVARNASVALGRDMTDSLNRVFKGAIKAEPELLDELGIILRLDTAARNYAATLGKTAKSLTVFEKQQAVTNEVIKQGTEKFSEFANVDVNPFTQLSAAFTDISASLLQLISAPIVPFLKFFNENLEALTAVVILFSLSVLKKAFPALNDFAEVMQTKLVTATNNAAVSLQKAEQSSVSFKQKLQGSTKASKKLLADFALGFESVEEAARSADRGLGKNFAKAFDKTGPFDLEKLKAYKAGLQQTIRALDKGAKASQGFGKADLKFLREELSETKAVITSIKDESIALTGKIQSLGKGAVASFSKAKLTVAAFGTELSRSATASALKGYTQGFKGVSEELKKTATNTSGVTRAFSLATGAIAGTGGALLKLLPIIGQLTIAWSILTSIFSFFKDKFVEKALVDLSETLEDNEEALNTAAKSAVLFDTKLRYLPDTLDNINKKATLLSNTFGTLAANLKKTLEDIDIDKGFGIWDEALDSLNLGQLNTFKNQIESTIKSLTKFGKGREATILLAKFNDLMIKSGGDATLLAKSLQELLDKEAKLARGTLDLNNALKESLGGLSKGLNQLNNGLPALTAAEQGFFNLKSILSAIDTGNVDLVTSSIASLNAVDLAQLGLSGVADNISEINVPVADLTEGLQKAEKALEALNKRRAMGGSLTEGRTQTEYESLVKDVATITNELDEISSKLGDQTDKIVEGLDKVKDRFNSIINAQKTIVAIRTQNAAANLEEGKGLDKRLELLSTLADAEANYIKTISEQTNISIASVKSSIYDLNNELDIAKAFEDKGSEASLNNSIKQEGIKLQQLENSILNDRNKIVSLYTKHSKTLRKELSTHTKYIAAGLDSSKELADVVARKLYTAYLNTNIALGKSKEEASALAAQMLVAALAAEDFKKFLIEAKIPSVDTLIGDTSSLEKRSQVLDDEAKYLRDNNVLLSERIDKEFILTDLATKRALVAAEARRGILEDSGDDKNIDNLKKINDIIQKLNDKLVANGIVRKKSVDGISASILYNINLEIKNAQAQLALGALATKQDKERLKRLQEINALIKTGVDTTGIAEGFKKLDDINFAQNIIDQIGEVIDALNPFQSALDELTIGLDNDDVNNFSAGVLALQKISKAAGDDISAAFFSMSLALDEFAKKMDESKVGTQEYLALVSQAIGAIASTFDEGSKKAEEFAKAQQVLAIISAVVAVLQQGEGDPYSAGARMAAMVGLVTSILGAANLAFGGVSGNANAGTERRATIGPQGLVGRELISNTFAESIDDLTDVNKRMFSLTRETHIQFKNLTKVFADLVRVLREAFGDFSTKSISEKLGVRESDITTNIDVGSGQSYSDTGAEIFGASLTSPSFIQKLLATETAKVHDALKDLGFSTINITEDIIDAVLQLSAGISFAGGLLTGSINDVGIAINTQITETTSDWWGLISKSNTRIQSYLFDVPDTVTSAIQRAIKATLDYINNLLKILTESVGVSLETLFKGITDFDLTKLEVDLKDKTIEEQNKAIAAWFTAMGNDVVSNIIPFITQYAKGSENALEALQRITYRIATLNELFATIGIDFSSFIDISNIDMDEVMNKVLADIVYEAVEAAEVAAAGGPTAKLGPGLEDRIASEVEAIKLKIAIAWQNALDEHFDGDEDFELAFNKFANVLYTETELLVIAAERAQQDIDAGLGKIKDALIAAGKEDIWAILAEGLTPESLKKAYEAILSEGDFAGKLEGEDIGTSGAELIALFIKLGASMADATMLAEKLEDIMEALNTQYRRQIEAFGLLGKALEHIQLDYEFADAMKDALETLTDISLVETYYALKRLEIIKKYNDEINDSLDASMGKVKDSIISVLRSAQGWNEVAYQSIKIAKLLSGISGTGVDLSVFDSTSDTSDFLAELSNFIEVTAASGSSITNQIDTVNELRQAILDRYDAEVKANEELATSVADSILALKTLSENIGSFISDLFIGDLSPLTNAQKLAEAQSQFDTNLQDVLSNDTELSDAAREDLLSSASALLELGNIFFSIGPEYQALFNSVVGALEALDLNIAEEIGLSEEALAIISLQESLTELQLRTINQLLTLDEILASLQEQNARDLEAELAQYFPDMVGNLEAILAQLQATNDNSWDPILSQLITLNNTMSTFVAQTGSYAKGSEKIDYDQVAMIHKGETILTADTSKAIRSGNAIYGAADALVSSGDSSDVVDAIRILTQVVATGQEDALDKQEEVRKATTNITANFNTVPVASTKGIV